jgi:hypothetical protein
MILSNQVICHVCGDHPYSATRHDFRPCDCPADTQVCVDGGMDYLRRVSGKNAKYTDISISLEQEHIDGLAAVITDKSKNDLGKVCNLVRYLRDELNINVSGSI